MAFTPTRGTLLSEEDQQSGGFTPTRGTQEQQKPTQDAGSSVLDTIPEAPKGPGLFTRIAQGIANPFLRTATNAINFAEGTAKLIGGDVQGANEASTKTRNFGFLGKNIRPVGVKEDGQFMKTGEFARDIAGTGLEIGSNLVGGGTAGSVGKATLKGAIWQGTKAGFKGGLLGGAMSAGGQALQDTEKTAGQVVGSTIKGGLLGGALGGFIGATAPLASSGLRSLYRTVNPTTKTLLTSAIKPGKNLGATVQKEGGKVVQKWDEVMDTALPDIAATVTKNKARGVGSQAIANADDLVAVTRQAKQEIWSEVKEMVGKHANVEIDGNKVADNIMEAITTRMRKEGSSGIKHIEETANAYRGKMSVEEAETILEEVNQELSSFYNKSPQAKYQSMSDPQLLADIKLAESLRSGLDDALERASGTGISSLKRRYGALTEFQKQLEGRIMVAKRQQPLNIPEQIQVAEGAAGALAKAAQGDLVGAAGQAMRPVFAAGAKAFGDMDNQIKRAFEKYMKANPVDGVRIPGVGPLGGGGLKQNIDDGLTPAVEKEIDDFPRVKTQLSPEDAAIEEAAIQKFVTNKKQMVDDYISKFGKVVNTDDARELFRDAGYNGNNAAAVHEASSALSKEVFKKLLGESKDFNVVFLGGGAGSGKTSAVGPKIDTADLALTFDGTLANYESTVKKLADVKAAGKRPTVFFTVRNMLDAWNGVVKRAIRSGRVVPIETHFKDHVNAYETVQKLIKDDPYLAVHVYDNNYGPGKATKINLDDFVSDAYKIDMKTAETLKKQAYEATKAKIASGEIPADIGAALLGE